MAAAPPSRPDLSDQDVTADELPSDGWLSMAEELAARGELRLALRALYLASLAYLAQKELISIAKHKSNRDYQRELGRRAHALPEVMTAFTVNVATFDRTWYGTHTVTHDLLSGFKTNIGRIKSCAES